MKDIISKRRKELGLTQQQLAEKLNISDKVVSKWETGRSLPDTSLLIPLAEALQISIEELMNHDGSSAKIEKTAQYEANTAYKNTGIITMAWQLVAVILIIAGRWILDRLGDSGSYSQKPVADILIVLGALCEIAAVAFYLVRRNHLLLQYPARTDYDKKWINIMLCCTYPLVLAAILFFVALHGLSPIEQLITSLISAGIALLPFAACFIWNQKRKDK